MFLATANQHQRLLCFHYVQHVTPADLTAARDDIRALLADLPPGFRLLADFSQLESMDPECALEVGQTMELLDRSQVSLIVRVIPDPARDIGMNILTVFHYPHHPRIITCDRLADALRKLPL